MPRDYQRAAVYAWEERVWGDKLWTQELELDECRAFVWKVWRKYAGADCEPPIVQDGRGRQSAAADRDNIWLPRHYRNIPTILHEISHSLIFLLENRTEETFSPHGPEFCRLLTQLWEDFGDVDLEKALEKLSNPELGPKGKKRHSPKISEKRYEHYRFR